MIIDFHTHAFADELAPRALKALSAASGGVEPRYDGSISQLLPHMDQTGADECAVLNIATKPTQQTRINDWAASINGGRIHAFGSIHPDAPNALEELERIRALGLPGVKLHPEYQGFFVDEERMRPIYKKIASLGLITVFHAGLDIGFMPPARTTPDGLIRALASFDGAPVIAAHFGGYLLWEDVLDRLAGLPLYLDTSFCAGRIPPPLARAIVEKHGTDRILFGTDLPWSDVAEEKRLIESLNLEEEDREKIYWKNARTLLGSVQKK